MASKGLLKIMPELLGLLSLNMIIFSKKISGICLKKRMKFIEAVIQDISLEELDAIEKIILELQ